MTHEICGPSAHSPRLAPHTIPGMFDRMQPKACSLNRPVVCSPGMQPYNVRRNAICSLSPFSSSYSTLSLVVLLFIEMTRAYRCRYYIDMLREAQCRVRRLMQCANPSAAHEFQCRVRRSIAACVASDV